MIAGLRGRIGSAGSGAALGGDGVRIDLDLDAGLAQGRDDVLDHHRQLDAREHLIGLRFAIGEAREDFAAARRLADQEVDILRMRTFGRQFALEFLGDERDRGERRAEFMRRRGGKAVESGQPLLARQDLFGRRQGRRHLARFFGDMAGIDRREDDAAQDRRPHAADIELRQLQCLPGIPGQRQMIDGKEGRAAKGDDAERRCPAQRQRRGRDRHRHEEEEGEGIFEPAGEIEQHRQLQDVIGEKEACELRPKAACSSASAR